MSSKERAQAELTLHQTVQFAPDFAKRLESFLPRLSAARDKREGAGTTKLASGGEEFVGFRPYQPGEDLRQLDWNLLARLDRPFVRTMRREASEQWSILVDGSGSMAVGAPGKFQRAAELAAALASLGLRRGARVVLRVSGAREGAREFVADRRSALGALLSFLEGQRAEGAGSFEALLSAGHSRRGMGRVFCLSDFIGIEPKTLLSLSSRGRELCAIQLLAPSELHPREDRAVEWADPETGERLRLLVDATARQEYEQRLEEWLSMWRGACAKHRALHGVWDSRSEFEEVLTELFAR